MKRHILFIAAISASGFLFLGCGPSAESEFRKAYGPQKDKDVTASPQYNFSSIAGTECKTRVKMAMAEIKRYSGAPDIVLLPPDRFDSTDPGYAPISGIKVIGILPPGTRMRVARLMQDQGVWGGVQVEAVLQDGTNAQKAVYLDKILLAGNMWSRGPTSNTNWDVNPEMLEVIK